MTDPTEGNAAAIARTRHMEVQHFADGGFVRRITDRIYGNVPPSPAPTPAPAPAAAPASAPEAPQSGIGAYVGNSALDRRMKAAGLKDGGVIKGPGTGTSDSISRDLPLGAFIMPADSTAALGAKNLDRLPETVPAMVSNGEFEVTPEKVHGLGAAVLTALRDTTHKPTDDAPKLGLMRRANGGLIDDPSRPNSFGDAAAAARDPGVTQAPTSSAPSYGLGVASQPQAAVAPAAPSTFNPALGAGQTNAVTRVGNTYSGGNVSGNVSINGQAPGGTFSTVAAPAPATAPATSPASSSAAQTSSVYLLRRPPPAAPAPLPLSGTPASRSLAGMASPVSAPTSAPAAGLGARRPAASDGGQLLAYRDGGVVDGSCVASGGFGLKKKVRRAMADGGLVEDEEAPGGAAPVAAAPAPVQSGGAAFGLYPQLAGDARTYGLANRLRQGVTASRGPEGQTFSPAVTVAPPKPPAAAPSAQRLNATTDPRSTTYQDPAAAPLATPVAESAAAAPALVVAPAPAAVDRTSALQAGVTRTGDSFSGTNVGDASAGTARKNPLGSMEDTQQQLANIQAINASTPQGGATIIDNAASEADRRAQFNEGANLANALARTSWSPRRGVQGDDAAVQAALTPIQLRAQAARSAQAQAAETDRALVAERGTEARAKISDKRQDQANSLAERRLAFDVSRVGADGVPSGYRRNAAGNLEFIPGGPADPASKAGGGKPLTEGQSKALLFGTRMQASNKILEDLEKAGKLFSTPGANAGYGIGAAVNLVNSKEGQQLDQAKRDFLNAVLRRESGAVIAEPEFASGDRQYFPQIGDSKEVIAQKRQNRELATRGILAEVPGADERVAQVRGPEAGAAARPAAPAAGAQDSGYTFVGGDPADPKSWRKS